MPRPPKNLVLISDFPGIMPNADPRDLPDGAAKEQVNCSSVVYGELVVRGGLQVVSFEDGE